MRLWFRGLAILVLSLYTGAVSQGSPQTFDLGGYDKPTVLEGVGKLRACTVAYLVEDYVANETYAARMQFTPLPSTIPLGDRLPCPSLVPPQVGEAALKGCRDHAEKPADCVFADMGREFHAAPVIANTSESSSRCMSDQASQIAMACWKSGDSDACNVGCGEDRDTAIAAARNRCEATQQKACTVTGALPVSAP